MTDAVARLRDLIAARPESERALLEAALRFADERHRGQRRLSGEDFIAHPVAVALTLAELNLDTPTLAAALLHDVREDCGVTDDELRAAFGEEIAFLVAGVSKLSALDTGDRVAAMADALRRMLLAMGRDIRVMLIKLADRQHNLDTIDALPAARRERLARETLELYAPLAHRLGMERVRLALQEGSFRILYPEAYAALQARVAEREPLRQMRVLALIARTDELLRAHGLAAQLEGRPKSLYSIHEKMRRERIPFERVFDLLGLRVIVATPADCYAALGYLHQQWPPLPNRFKDYIARPKSNGYQSLHTVVTTDDGVIAEFQIRTVAMHRHALEGVAAHWLYKEEGAGRFDAMQRLGWYKRLLDSLGAEQDAGQVVRAVKAAVAQPEVLVFTPDGDVKELPEGSTPVDFAFTVHTEVGRTCVGARVNGRMVPLSHRLQHGDIVEIITQKGHQPSRDWLKFVVSATARARIKRVLREQDEARARQTGRELLEKAARQEGLKLERVFAHERFAETLARHRLKDGEALYAALAAGRLTARAFVQDLAGAKEKRPAPGPPAAAPAAAAGAACSSDLLVDGICDPYARLAHCCHPVPGDAVFGYVTRGRGVTVHRDDCPNRAALRRDAARVVPVAWRAAAQQRYRLRVQAQGRDRRGLLSDALVAIAAAGAYVLASHAEAKPDGGAALAFDVEVRDSVHGEQVLQRLRETDGITAARRR